MTLDRCRLSRFPLLALAVLFVGCGPSWKVIRASGPPSALKDVNEVAIRFDYASMSVEGMNESEWVTQKSAEDVQYPNTWADLKGRLEAAVLEGLRDQVPLAQPLGPSVAPGVAVLTVQVHGFRLGKFVPVVLPPTVVQAGLVWQVGGQVADEIFVERSFPSSILAPSVFNHIGPVGQRIGETAGRFLISKRGG